VKANMSETTTLDAPIRAAASDGLRGAIAFEWTKLWTVRSTWWSLAVAVLVSAGSSTALGMSAAASGKNGIEVTESAPHVAVYAITLAQLAILVLATLTITSEYATGSIRTTLQSVPVRGRMLAGKVVVVTGVAFVAGVLLATLGTVVAAPVMGDHGEFTIVEASRTAVGVGTYLALLACFTIGVGTILRSAAGTVTAVILLLVAFPQIMGLFGVDWLRDTGRYLPNVAGTVLMTHNTDPYGVGTALTVLGAWATFAVAGGYVTLRARDA